jgi:hypothetical protein
MQRGESLYNKRAIGLLVLLCFTVFGQWCLLNAEHQQHRADEHCCLLCHTGPHALLDVSAPVFHAPVFSAAWIVPVGETPAKPQTPVYHSSPRAPPSISHS